DFGNPVTYRVTAADDSTHDYVVTVTVAPSPAKDITSFKFLSAHNSGLGADVTAAIDGTSITATVPFGTVVTALVADFTTTGASVSVSAVLQTSGVTANNFTSPVVYRVTAADASTKDYTVTVTIAPNPVPPTVTNVQVQSTSPDNGSTPYNTGTATVVITGTNFSSVTCPGGVKLDDLNGAGAAVSTATTNCTVDSSTQITATFPAGIRTNGATGWNVLVTNSFGSNATSSV